MVLTGPETSEFAKENPFLDYKLEAIFTNGTKSFKVPGFYAADGFAAESSADAGNVWIIRFCLDETETWSYKVSFRKGKDIVVKEGENLGESVSGDGIEGSFEIASSDKSEMIFVQKVEL